MTRNYLTLTRQALYDLVWSKPMTHVAKEFGISDVALAKRCAAVSVPVPKRGYWAQVAAGQTPPRPPLPRYRVIEPELPASANEPPVPSRRQPRTTARALREPLAPSDPVSILKRDPQPPAGPLPAEHEDLDQQLQQCPPTPRPTLRNAHAAVKRTALALRAERVKDFDWNRNERSGPVIGMSVPKALIPRALRIADALLRSAEQLGWSFDATAPKDEPDSWRRPDVSESRVGWMHILGESMRFALDEPQKQIPHVLTKWEKDSIARGHKPYARRWDLVGSGALRLTLINSHGSTIRSFRDGRNESLEALLPAVLHAMLAQALEDSRRREARRLEAERQRERERLEAELRQRREAHTGLAAQLEAQAGAWWHAQQLRRYLRAVRRAFPNHTVNVDLLGERTDFLAWADRYVDQLDPLHAEPRDPDLRPAAAPYYRADADAEDLRAALARLSGQRWPQAWKLHAADNGKAAHADREAGDFEDGSC